MKLEKGVTVPDFTYLSPYSRGEKHFADFAGGEKTFLVFLRYYGCTVCRLDLHIYSQRFEEFRQKGVKLAVVLQSDPALVAGEAPDGTFPFEIMCDPTRSLYEEFEIKPAKSKLALVGGGLSKALKKMKAAKEFGFVHGQYEGNEQQLPAMVLVGEDGKVAFSHYAKNIADMPGVDRMLALV